MRSWTTHRRQLGPGLGGIVATRESRLCSGAFRKAIIIHGYGGSAQESAGHILPKIPHPRLDWIFFPDLPGHGESACGLSLGNFNHFVSVLKEIVCDEHLIVGFSLGAVAAAALGSSNKILVSPPGELPNFDKNNRREILASLTPRNVREAFPMSGLAEILRAKPEADATSLQRFFAQDELPGVERKGGQIISGTSHASIFHSPQLWVEIRDLLDQRIQSGKYDSGLNREFYLSVADKLLDWASCERPLGGAAKALDLGCGTGFSLEAGLAFAPAARWVGLDADPSMLAAARKKDSLHQVEFTLARADSLPFQDKTFDLAISSFALHRMNFEKIICEAKRVLKNEGRLVISVPLMNSESEASGNIKLRRSLRRGQGLGHFGMRRKEWEKMRAVCGARIIESIFVENFESPQEMFDALTARGSYAPFGVADENHKTLNLEWKIGFFDLQI